MQTDLKALLDKLLSEDDWEPVEFINDRGESAFFHQIALLPVTEESGKYVDESVEHNFAILHPLDENGEETGDELVIDITVDKDQTYALQVIENRELISEIVSEYREVRGITPEDLAINQLLSDDGEIDGGVAEGTDETEVEEADDNEPSESDAPLRQTKRSGFFSRLFGKKK